MNLPQREAHYLATKGVQIQLDDAGGGWHAYPSDRIAECERTQYRIDPSCEIEVIRMCLDEDSELGCCYLKEQMSMNPIAIVNEIETLQCDQTSIVFTMIVRTGEWWNNLPEFDGF